MVSAGNTGATMASALLRMKRLPGVARVHSSFALRTVQKSRELPIRAY